MRILEGYEKIKGFIHDSIFDNSDVILLTREEIREYTVNLLEKARILRQRRKRLSTKNPPLIDKVK